MTDKLKLTKKVYLSAEAKACFNTLVIGADDSGIIEESIKRVPYGTNIIIADAGDELWTAYSDKADADCKVYHYSEAMGKTSINLAEFFTKSFAGKILFVNLFEGVDEGRRRILGGRLGNVWNEGATAIFYEALDRAKTKVGWYGERTTHTRFILPHIERFGALARHILLDLLERAEIFDISFLLTTSDIGDVEKVCTWRATDRLRAIPNKVFGRTDRIENLAFFSEVTGLDRLELTSVAEGRALVTISEGVVLEDLTISCVRDMKADDGERRDSNFPHDRGTGEVSDPWKMDEVRILSRTAARGAS